jgi:AraC-like DNA-binding protein
MITLLDSYISNLISKSKEDNPIITHATTKIARYPSKEVLMHIQKELHITERTFQRVFEKNIGIAPNVYRRICQFNNAFQQLNNRKFNKLSDIAFHNGYSDQSHFIRAFKEFTQLAPNIYLNQA